MAKTGYWVLRGIMIIFVCEISCYAYGEAGKPAMDVYSMYRLKPFDTADVTLHGDLKRQFDEVCEYYYDIPNDNLLKPYRQRAGLAAPGDDMGGAYVAHGPFGQFLAGYARMYAATGDEKYRTKAVTLMNEWAKTIAPDGFFFATQRPHLSAYIYEKMMGGLLDIYYYCGDRDALRYLDTITAWAESHIPRTRVYCDVLGQGTGEWYTLSENLYRAYLYTGDQRYKTFGELWEYKEFWDEIRGGDYEAMYKKKHWHHAYSHVNSFNGLAGAYIVGRGEAYLDTLKKAYDFMQEEQCYSTGGFGPQENLPPREQLVRSLGSTDHSFETQCGSWAIFKMTQYLVGLTGDARYANWTEKAMINGIGASIPMTADGKVFYYSSYKTTGAVKRYRDSAWPCCSGTRAEAVPDYHHLLYFHDDENVYVSQYFASEVLFKTSGRSVHIVQETRFPQEDTTRLVIHTESPVSFGIRFRIPEWVASKITAEVNGKAYDYQSDHHWGIIMGNWKDGDVIRLKLPMGLEVSRIDSKQDYPASILYGPVALAVKGVESVVNPAMVIDLDTVCKDFVRSETEPMAWRLRGNDSILLKPFYAYTEGERYFLYLDKNAAQIFPVSKDSNTIFVLLENPQKSSGILLLDSSRETLNKPVVKNDRPGWMATQMLGGDLYYMYYRVTFDEFRNGQAAKVMLSVDYFDEGRGNFQIIYDSSDAAVKVSAKAPGAWKKAGGFRLADTKTWKTYECVMDDAQFSGRCNDNDIRFEIHNADACPVVGKVTLTRR